MRADAEDLVDIRRGYASKRRALPLFHHNPFRISRDDVEHEGIDRSVLLESLHANGRSTVARDDAAHGNGYHPQVRDSGLQRVQKSISRAQRRTCCARKERAEESARLEEKDGIGLSGSLGAEALCQSGRAKSSALS